MRLTDSVEYWPQFHEVIGCALLSNLEASVEEPQFVEEHLVNLPYTELESANLSNDTRVWFVTTYAGKYVGVLSASWLFVFELPPPCCLCIRIFDSPAPAWEHRAICELAEKHSPPDILVTDKVGLQHALVSAGSTFSKPAKAYIDKALSRFPEIPSCLRSLEEVLNDREFQSQSLDGKNAMFASWRTRYNEKLASK
ncbi:conserved hypothetical protein [Paraburkholderia caribensis]|nr:conserved hypothetical protein [Paraburkholderia caribensis]